MRAAAAAAAAAAAPLSRRRPDPTGPLSPPSRLASFVLLVLLLVPSRLRLRLVVVAV